MPMPTALRVLEGNRGHRPPPAHEPQPRPVTPKMPAHLDSIARREWRRLVPILTDMRVLTETDGINLALLCQTYSRLIQAQQALSKSSLLLKTSSGYVQQSPLISIISAATEQLVKLCREFGLSPASRCRLQTEPSQRHEADDGLIR
jgi:P27 family predicted phage terminase small subunit